MQDIFVNLLEVFSLRGFCHENVLIGKFKVSLS